jgi:hypothetical protein
MHIPLERLEIELKQFALNLLLEKGVITRAQFEDDVREVIGAVLSGLQTSPPTL